MSNFYDFSEKLAQLKKNKATVFFNCSTNSISYLDSTGVVGVLIDGKEVVKMPDDLRDEVFSEILRTHERDIEVYLKNLG